MKLNNKGFTLIEVLAVVVILAVVGGIAVKSVLNTINNSKKSSYNIMIENIKTASKVIYEEIENNDILYLGDESQDSTLYDYDFEGQNDEITINNNSITIHIQALVSNGFLNGVNNECNEDGCNQNKKIILNPKTKEDIGDCIIVIKKVGDNYYVSSQTNESKCPTDDDYGNKLSGSSGVVSDGTSSSETGTGSTKLLSSLDIGNYVSYTPTRTNVTLDKAKTGYSNTQTINPSKLTLWRVIKKNGDGSVEAVSHYITDESIFFTGKIGYMNYIGYLNEISKMFEDPTNTYIKGSRHFGYSNQTSYITDTSKFTNTSPWNCSTNESCNPVESQGGGDVGYVVDYNLVKTAIGAKLTDSPTNSNGNTEEYWISSRKYIYDSATDYRWDARTIVYTHGKRLYVYLNGFQSNDRGYPIRPILIFNSGLKCVNGTGSSDSPCKIN